MIKERKTKSTKKTEPKMRNIKVRLIGIGGGGGSIVSSVSCKVKGASFFAVDTDIRALKGLSRKIKKIHFGQDITHGLGTGMDFEIGKESIKNEKEKIKNIFKDQDIVVLVGCLGGGLASGAASVLADLSKKAGNLTYGIFTLPFKFEGKRKAKIAKKSLKEIRNHINAFSVIPNERIFQIIEKTAPLKKALAVINNHLSRSIQGLIEVIYETGLINIDFADIETIFSGRGKLAYLNSIKINKNDDKKELAKKLIDSPLYPYSIDGGEAVLFNISGQKNLSLSQVNKIAEAISEKVYKNAKIIFGISNSKNKTITRVNLLVVGCDQAKFFKKDEEKKIKKRILKKKEAKKTKSETKEKKLKKEIQKVKKTKRKKRSKKIKIKIEKEKQESKKIRKNALQVKEDIKKEEEEIISKENLYKVPTFLRKK